MDEKAQDRRQPRWPGLVLNFFVPGFGLVRAGLPRRGIAWFLGNLLLGIIAGLSLAMEMVPVWLVCAVVIGAVIFQILMLRDGFRPGRMTGRLWLLFIVIFLVTVLLPSPLLSIVRSFRIPTGGMEPTFLGSKSGSTPDHVVADLLSYRFTPPQRGDVIVFSTAGITALNRLTGSRDDSVFLQRIVGMPGETIRIEDGNVFVNGRQLGEADGIPSFQYENPRNFRERTALMEGKEFLIGPDEYFVLGDNVSNSLDSRYWGEVPKSSVIGKVTMIYYPFSRMRREF